MSLLEAPDPACPDWGDWLEYHFETSAWQERLQAHLSGCQACQRTVADLQHRLAAGAAEDVPQLPARFWEDQCRDIMARLPRKHGTAFRYWPAAAASVCAALLGGTLLWHSNRGLPPVQSSTREDRFMEKVIDRAASSPSRGWVGSLNYDPELGVIRELARVGDPL